MSLQAQLVGEQERTMTMLTAFAVAASRLLPATALVNSPSLSNALRHCAESRCNVALPFLLPLGIVRRLRQGS